MIIIIFLLILVFGFLLVKFPRAKKRSIGEIVFIFGYVFAFLLFATGMLSHWAQYGEAIDPLDNCYTPFGGKHFYSLLFYLVMFQFSLGFIWLKGRKSPPLFLVFCLIFLLAGILLNFIILIQVASHNTETLDMYTDNGGSWFFIRLF